MRKLGLIAWAAAATIFAVIAGFSGSKPHVRYQLVKTQTAETIYVTNLAPKFISDAEIKRDIPNWEHAVNVDFASYWHTAHYHIVFLGRKPAPSGAISAVFLDKGPVKGALAYHWTERGNSPSITVYAGTGAYYGFDNSVSFTHELFEMAADPVTSYLNVGYPTDYVWLEGKDTSVKMTYTSAIGWMSEVADPVESDSYDLNGTRISDFVTPAWFADGVGNRFDYLGLCQQPFWIRPGGYATYMTASGWSQIFNFRKGHPADAGFSKGEPERGATEKR